MTNPSSFTVGALVQPRGHSPIPWSLGRIESISDQRLQTGLHIGVRLLEAATGYLEAVAFFRDDEIELAPEQAAKP
jgi:hypothetical protein